MTVRTLRPLPQSCPHSGCPEESSCGNCAALSLGQGMLCQVLGYHNPCPGPLLLVGFLPCALPSNLDFQGWLVKSLVWGQVSPARSMASRSGQGTNRDGGFCWLLVLPWERKRLPQGLGWQDGRWPTDACRKGPLGKKAGSSANVSDADPTC